MWSFFDQIGDQFEIKFKLSENMTWQKYSWEREPSAVGILFNPDHNLNLAHYNLVEHLVADLQTDPDHFENFSSYKLLSSFLFEDASLRWPNTLKIQFKIVVSKATEKIDFFTSPWIEVKKS